jgi:hypothetical protein
MPDNQRFWAAQMHGELNFLVCKNADHNEQSGLLEWLPRLCAFAESVRAHRPRPRVCFEWRHAEYVCPLCNRIHTQSSTTIAFLFTPQLTWSIDDATGNITVTTDTQPVAMSVAVADSPQDVSAGRRDFRWAARHAQPCEVKVVGDVCFRPVLWATYPLNATADSTAATVAAAAAAGIWHQTKHRRADLAAIGADASALFSVTVGVPLPPVAGQFRAFMIEVAWANAAGADDFVQTSGVSVVPNVLPFPPCQGAQCAGTLC